MSMTVENLLNKIEQLSFLLNNPAEPNINVKELGRMRSIIYEDFKLTIFKTKEIKENAWNAFQEVVAKLKEAQELSNQKSEAYALEAVTALNDLYQNVTTKAEDHSKEVISSLKEQIATVFQYFKQPNWPNKEIKDENWEKFSAIRDVVKLKEDKYYESLRAEKELLAASSDKYSSKLAAIVNLCHPTAEMNDLKDSLSLMNHAALDGALLTQENSYFASAFDESKPLKTKSDALSAVRKFIVEHRDALTREDKQKIFATIDIVQKDLDQAWTIHKQEQQKKKEEWTQRQIEQEAKKSEWLANQKNFANMLEGRIKNQTQFKHQLEAFMAKQMEFLSRGESRIANQVEYLIKLDQQLVDLEEKIATARSDSFKEKAEGWLVETVEKKSKVAKEIEELKEKLIDAEKRKIELAEKIVDIEKGIAEIQDKYSEVTSKLATA